ncbi:hypothetical protein GCM10023190_19450 [Enteractinococcus fodinae]|uniref:Uncharacterized protein n=1 Tax=Enteractinococcus fodinae TaxID=684663 RepID=A0ABU2B3W3_9MICC|nr:hypothetical protein [Enteractinococcus fodinae]MDR7348295.1 hypothetical protein [Enteractinococcus fodinae]
MSVELSAIVFCAVGFVIILGGIIFAGLTWFLRRMEARFEKVYQRFDQLEQRFDEWDEKVA